MQVEKLLIALNLLKGVGKKTALKFYNNLTSKVENANDLEDQITLYRGKGYKFPITSKSLILDIFSKADHIIEESLKSGHEIISYADAKYPTRIRKINDPPLLLFAKGNTSALENAHIGALIGKRKPSTYGIEASKTLGIRMAEESITVVSGMAAGCDTAGHFGCLSNDGIAVGVLAHGLDTIFPRTSEKLAEKLLEKNGLLISEYPFGTQPTKFSYVERDRIQSGLSDFVFVVETDVEGGTMHTVGFAEKQHRQVTCLDFPEDAYDQGIASGNKMLIKERRAVSYSLEDNFNDFITSITQNILSTESKIDTNNQKVFDF